MTRNELINQYIKWGWRIVPVLKGTKRPAIDWKKYQDPDLKIPKEQYQEWFSDPETGVGVITGTCSGIMVVDEDTYKKEGKDIELQTPLIVRTGRGGKHYYFKHKDGITNSVNKETAVDIRGTGGFAVLPPTLHPDTNQPYEWLTPLPPRLDDLPAFDESLAQEFIRQKELGKPLNIKDYMHIGEGSRDDSLLRAALSIVNKVGKENAYEIIRGINATYDPPLPDHDVDRIFEQAVKFVDNNPKKNAEELQKQNALPLDVLSYEKAREHYEDMVKRYGNGITTGYKILDAYFKFIPQQLYMISAPTHVGKTTFVMNMAGRMADAGVKVCVASLEQGVFIIPRLETMFPDISRIKENMTFVVPDDLPTPQDFIKTFEDEKNRPQVLVVDHLHFFKRGNKGATEEMDRLVIEMQQLAHKLEIPVITIAHLRKLNAADKDKIPTMDDLKDSSSLSQVPGVVMLMHRKKNSDEIITAGGSFYSNDGTLFIAKNRVFGQTGNLDYRLAANGEVVFTDSPEDQINPAPIRKDETESLGLLFDMEGLDLDND